MMTFDVAIIGGGIIGTSSAAYLAEAGLSVILLERAELAAGASGRNSGVIQHPFDGVLAELHGRSVELYRDPAMAANGFELPAHPAGLMLISFDEGAVIASAADIARSWPSLAPEVLSRGAAAALEPSLHPDLAACRIETGYPVAPAAATLAFARRAERAGAAIRTSSSAAPEIEAGKVTGLRFDNETIACNQVLVAAGPWTPSLVPGWAARPPIRPVWGVVVSTSLRVAQAHVLEEIGIDRPGGPSDRLFSLMTAGQATSVGSTFLEYEPDAQTLASEIVERAVAFVPSLRDASIASVRACARPVAFDGRPLIGAIPGVGGLFVCAGHGPWGISTGPGSARLVADVMLGVADERSDLSPLRLSGVTD